MSDTPGNKHLQYPDDRVNGYVQLSCDGQLFVPDKRASGDTTADAMRYAGAFLAISRRHDQLNRQKDHNHG